MPKDAERGKTGGTPFRKEKFAMNTIFESLEKTTSRLNDTADSANELIRVTNERLEALGAGVSFTWDHSVLREEFFSEYNEENDCQMDAGFDLYVLSFTKIYGTWQLCVQKQHYVPSRNEYDTSPTQVGSEEDPLLNADRELRIKAASRLPGFLKQYTAYLEELADELD